MENPLITIIIVTYNSSDYVIEALESAKLQTYHNIELIVTDDCSTDNTVEICRNWIEENRSRFLRTELLTFETNTGIAPNCNRGCKAAKGEWIQMTSGDDALESNYCEQIISYLNINPNALCIITNVTRYKDCFTAENIIYKTDLKKFKMFSDDITPEQQFQCLLRYNVVYGAGVINNKKIYENFGYYDEKYPFFEDRPFWLKITKANIKIFLYEVYGAKYRVHSKSVLRNKKDRFWTKYRESYYYAIRDFLMNYPYFERLLRKSVLEVEFFFYKLFDNKRNFFALGIIFIITKIPNLILSKIRKKYL